MQRRFYVLLLAACLARCTSAGEYRNPILPGFYPDPSICRSGDDYYLVTSSFEYFPGVPIFHSKDLVHWRQLGHVLTRPSQLPLAGQASSNGIFAPTLRCPPGHFYMITTNFGGASNFIVHAADPAGLWSEPAWIHEGKWGIDPSLLFDDDGKVYFTRADDGEHGGINQAEIDPATGKLAGPLRRIWNGTGGTWPEAPHLYKVNGWYYLMIAEGGTGYDHAVTVARARTPWGPFEPAPNNPVLLHRTLPALPIQATGHADLVQTPSGHWFMVLLGIEPVDRAHHLGRETFLAPVAWTADGWLQVNGGAPIATSMAAAGLPAPHPWPATPVREEFTGPALGLEWVFLRGPADGLWSLAAQPGSLRLTGSKVGLAEIGTPAFIGRRQQHVTMRAATLLDFAPVDARQSAGLSVRMNEDNHYLLVVAGDGHDGRVVRLTSRIKGVTATLAEAPLPPGPVELAVRAGATRYVFGYRVGTRSVIDVGSAPTRALSSELAGGFTGVVLGPYAHNGGTQAMAPADFAWFDYAPGR